MQILATRRPTLPGYLWGFGMESMAFEWGIENGADEKAAKREIRWSWADSQAYCWMGTWMRIYLFISFVKGWIRRRAIEIWRRGMVESAKAYLKRKMQMRIGMRTGSCKKRKRSAYFILANIIQQQCFKLTCEHHRNSSLSRNRVEGEEGNVPSEGPTELGHSEVVGDLRVLTLTRIQLETEYLLPTSSTA